MGFFDKGLEGFAGAGSLGKISWDENKIKIILVDMDDAGPSAGAFRITGCTYSTLTVTVTTQAAHGMTTGDRFEIWGVGGITNVTGEFVVASAPTTTTFTFVATVQPTGTYTSGGYIADLSLTYLSQFVVSGGRIATSGALTAKSVTNGYLDANDVVYSAVTGDPVEAWVAVRAAAQDADADLADTAQRLILLQSPASPGLTGLPQTPSAGNINLTFASQGVARI